jgi:dTDP-glucose 4,6-dehydratase
LSKYFVTGGAGFIGSNFVRRLLDRGVEVTNFDALTYAGVKATVDELDAYPNHRFVHGDVRAADDVVPAIAGHDVVVHFAAESHVDRSIDGPAEFLSTNVLGTGVLLDAAVNAEIPQFVHVSTDEVYGSVATGFPDESSLLRPSSPYAASKASSDLLALSYLTTYGYPVVVTRCTNNFGAYQFPEKVIPLFVTNLIEGLSVPVYGDGSAQRDWLHVEDHCSALDIVIERGEGGTVYNIGADAQLANIELTRRLLELTDRDDSFIEFVADRPGHDYRYAVDSSRVRALGWKPSSTLETRLAETVDWYRARSDWWQPLKGRS